MTPPLRPTVAVVDASALVHNVEALGARVRRPMMGIVKANAYGHGLVDAARIFVDAGVSALGVAFLEEGIELRRAGIQAPILVLGGIIGNQIRAFIDHDLSMTASSVFKLQQISAAAEGTKRFASVHLKIDTGMGRIGMQWDTASELLEAARTASRCRIDGIFSHLATAEDAEPEQTQLQRARFEEATGPYAGLAPRHLANSGAILQHPDTWYDMVRPGLALYGVAPREGLASVIALRPALSLYSRVVYFKVLEPGRTVSYGATWTTPRRTRVITLPVGYGDGYPRRLSNRAQVVVRGQRAPVVGRVTMDAVMVDIGPDGTAYNGDPVLLLGDGSISVHEMARWQETSPYEVLTAINTRVPRVIVDEPGPPKSWSVAP